MLCYAPMMLLMQMMSSLLYTRQPPKGAIKMVDKSEIALTYSESIKRGLILLSNSNKKSGLF